MATRSFGLPLALGAMVAVIGTAHGLDYRVRPGDTLSEIASRYGISVRDLMAHNGLRSTTIVVGQVLEVPGPDETDGGGGVHVVRDGESLWMIALRYRVTTNDLKRANGLRGDLIRPGDRLEIPGGASNIEAPANNAPSTAPPVDGVSQADLEILARIIKGECPPDTPTQGKIAVAAVILNRVKHPSFPDTIRGVAHQPFQFSCYNRNVRNRLYNGPIPQWAWDAAREAVRGVDPSRGATHYFNPHIVRPSWARHMRFLVRIGTQSHTTHDFYKM